MDTFCFFMAGSEDIVSQVEGRKERGEKEREEKRRVRGKKKRDERRGRKRRKEETNQLE